MKLHFVIAAIVFILSGLIAGNAGADAPGSDPFRNSENSLIFHCTNGGIEHPVTQECAGTILLDREPPASYTCGQCIPDAEVSVALSVYSEQKNASNEDLFASTRGAAFRYGSFSFGGQKYFNGETEHGRANGVFCTRWLSASPDEFDGSTVPPTCVCSVGLIPGDESTHGRCRRVTEQDCLPHQQFVAAAGTQLEMCVDREPRHCPTPGHFLANPGGTGGTCADCDMDTEIAENGQCRFPNSHVECWQVERNEPFYDETESDNCRPASLAECAQVAAEVIATDPANSRQIGPFLQEVSDGHQCAPPESSAQCRQLDPMNPILGSEAISNITGDSDPNSAARVARLGFGETNTEECSPGTDARCAAVFLAEGLIGDADGSCRAPQNGLECRRLITSLEAFVPADPDAVYDGACAEECSAGEIAPEEDNFVCRERTLNDCGDDEYLDVNDNRMCRDPVNGMECRERKGAAEDNEDVFENDDCADSCEDDRQALAPAFRCMDPTDAHCQSSGMIADGRTCRAPTSDGECKMINPAHLYVENVGCRDECPSDTHFRESDVLCVLRIDVSECDDNETVNMDTNLCECPSVGHTEVGGECEVNTNPETCVMNAEVDSSTNRCECTNRDHAVFDNDTESDMTDDFCAETRSDCRDDQVINGRNECVCDEDQMEMEFNKGGTLICESQIECAEGMVISSGNECVANCLSGQTLNSSTNICECARGQAVFAEDRCEVIRDQAFCDPNRIYNNATNSCDPRSADQCLDNHEFVAATGGEAGGRCVECTGGQTLENGACRCPAARSFENSNGVCEESLAETCTPIQEYNSDTNECDPRMAMHCGPDHEFSPAEEGATGGTCVQCEGGRVSTAGSACACPAGQRENEDQTACEAVPASSGGGGGGGGGAAALIAVPIVLIGGYWLLGGFGYVDPVYDFGYSGENGNLEWHGNAGFNLQHGGLRSYASALQSNGDAVSYESGLSYERDFLSLTYDATESDSEYLYDLGASMKAEFGLWTIVPEAESEFKYQLDENSWESKSSVGLSAVWASHLWEVRASSDIDSYSAGVIRRF